MHIGDKSDDRDAPLDLVETRVKNSEAGAAHRPRGVHARTACSPSIGLLLYGLVVAVTVFSGQWFRRETFENDQILTMKVEVE
jgi:hypothetical protein